MYFYDVAGGNVRIGGQDVRDMSPLENIRLGKPDATDEEVLAAAEKAQCGTHDPLMKQGGSYKNFVTVRKSSQGISLTS